MSDRAKQKQRIIDYCLTHTGITQYDASARLSVARLPSRIHDLKKDGYEFADEWCEALNQFGEKVRYKKYRLVGLPK